MKQFFIKSTSVTKPKNGLQEAIHELMDKYDQTLISIDDLFPWINKIKNKIVMLNRKHHRCCPEEFEKWSSSNNNIGAKACSSYHLAIWEVKG